METRIAMQISDAMVRRGHPRLDFRTEEGRRYAMRLAPYLSSFVNKDSKALDLGCGTGKSTFVLTELGASVTGIDISILSLKFAKEIAKTINAEAFHALGDYAYLPFRSSSFDLALFPHNVVECSPEEFNTDFRDRPFGPKSPERLRWFPSEGAWLAIIQNDAKKSECLMFKQHAPGDPASSSCG